MKRYLLVLALAFITAACTPMRRELFAIHIHGDWCKTCAVIDQVIHSTEDYFQNTEGITYLVFDETSPESVAKSATVATKHGLSDLFEYERHTGEFIYVDKATKTVLTRFYGVDSQQKYINTAEILMRGGSMQDILAKRRQYKLSKPDLKTVKKAKLLVVDIHHDMCGGCAITAPVFEEVALDYVDNKKIVFMTFDLTTKETTDASKKLAYDLGLQEIFNGHKHTGEVLFIHRKKKKILDTLVLEKDKSKYHQLIKAHT